MESVLFNSTIGFWGRKGFFEKEKEKLLGCLRKQHHVIVSCGKIKDNNPQTPTLSVHS